MPTTVCEACGMTNPADATFCRSCQAFVGWDRTSMITAIEREPTPSAAPMAEENIETRVMPAISTPRTAPATEVLAVRLEQDQVTLPISGEPAQVALTVTNRSDIVDGYEVDAGGAPDWLIIESAPLRLLPGAEEQLVLGFRIRSERLVAAGRATVRLRVRSLTQHPAHQVVSIGVVVPVVDAPVRLRTEPAILRLADVEVGRFVLVIDNDANRPAEVRLTGTDPELAVAFHFDPGVVVVGPGESVRVRVATTSEGPRPGAELTRALTVSAIEGKRRVDTVVTLVQTSTAVVEDPMVELILTPSLLRLRDTDTATARVRVDNRAGQRWATVRLEASDPERVVAVQWGVAEVRVPPGGTTDVDVRLSCPTPEPGSEVRHTVTLSATDGRRAARAQLDLVCTASASPMTTLAIGLDPSVLRLGTGRRGTSSVIVDNRSGRAPVRVRLHGDDPENVVAFTFVPPELTVGPGQLQTGRMTVVAPRAPAGRELSRPLTVAATDGRTSVSTTGSLIQTGGDRRPWARVALTLLGALTVFIATMLPLLAVSERSSFGIGADTVAGLFGADLNLGALEPVISFGLLIMVLAGLMVFGLTGRSGRLTRWTAVLIALLTVGLLITIAAAGIDASPGAGTIAIILGAALGYLGGLLARR